MRPEGPQAPKPEPPGVYPAAAPLPIPTASTGSLPPAAEQFQRPPCPPQPLTQEPGRSLQHGPRACQPSPGPRRPPWPRCRHQPNPSTSQSRNSAPPPARARLHAERQRQPKPARAPAPGPLLLPLSPSAPPLP